MAKNICKVNNCNKFVHGLGFCQKHYFRIRRYGTIKIECEGQSRPKEHNGMYGVRRFGKKNPFFHKKHSEETKKKISETKKGIITNELHPAWKGERASYDAIHVWVRKHKTKLNKCTKCGKTKNETKLHWANKDHKYKRNLDDYLCLCVKCHWEYDKKFNNKHAGVNKKDLHNFNKYKILCQ